MNARFLCAVILAALLPTAAQAHLVNSGLGPFYDGVSHFVLTPEDVLPVLALALLAGLRGARAGRLILFALPVAWFTGGVAGLTVPFSSAPSALTALTLLALGGLVAADARLNPKRVAYIGLALGMVFGYLNGSAMAEASLGAMGLAGIVTALFVLVALASALVASLRIPWTRVAVRVAGSWIVAIGLLLLGWSFRAEPSRTPAKQAHQNLHTIERIGNPS